jgi:hypothetical protein
MRYVLLSLLLTAAVAAGGAVAKVRLDARAHLARADALAARAGETGNPADLAAAGEAYAAAIASCTPFDPAVERAARRLLAVSATLAAAQQPGAATRLLAAGLRSIDSCAVLTHPLAAERAEMEAFLPPAGPFDAPPER